MQRPQGCFKLGCAGCLVLLALGVGVTLLLSVVSVTVDRGDPRPETREASHPLPDAPRPPRPPEAPEAPEPPETGEGSEVSDAPDVPDVHLGMDPASAELGRVPTRRGRVVLDVRTAELVVEPGPAGEPIRLLSDYDANGFELEETFEDGESWEYRVDFAPRGGMVGLLMGGGVESSTNRLKLILPRDQPMDLIFKVGLGESEMDLGGLWLGLVDLELGVGEHFLEFREPTATPVDEIIVDGSIGEMELRRLGNASPAAIRVDQSVGEMTLGLEGDWRRDAEVDVDFGIGEARVFLPDTARIVVEKADVAIGERFHAEQDEDDLPPGAPTLRLRLQGNLGEVTIDR